MRRADRYVWRAGDCRITQPDGWVLTYPDGEATVLVQDARGLLNYLAQTAPSGDLRKALATFMGSAQGRDIPPVILDELGTLGWMSVAPTSGHQ